MSVSAAAPSNPTPVDRLSAIRARLNAATPGPWEVDEIPETGECRLIVRTDPEESWEFEPITAGWTTRKDADFMAAAPSDVGWLLERIDAVLKLHIRVSITGVGYANNLGKIQYGDQCSVCHEKYPCPSVRALGVEA